MEHNHNITAGRNCTWLSCRRRRARAVDDRRWVRARRSGQRGRARKNRWCQRNSVKSPRFHWWSSSKTAVCCGGAQKWHASERGVRQEDRPAQAARLPLGGRSRSLAILTIQRLPVHACTFPSPSTRPPALHPPPYSRRRRRGHPPWPVSSSPPFCARMLPLTRRHPRPPSRPCPASRPSIFARLPSIPSHLDHRRHETRSSPRWRARRTRWWARHPPG